MLNSHTKSIASLIQGDFVEYSAQSKKQKKDPLGDHSGWKKSGHLAMCC